MHKTAFLVCATLGLFFMSCSGSEEEKSETTDNPAPKATTVVDTLPSVEDTLAVVEPVEQVDPGTCFKSAKVDSLMKTVAVNDDPDDWETNAYLSDEVLADLTAEEVLVYCLNYPGSFTQNCAEEMAPDEPNKYLMAYLPMSDEELSVAQEKALENRAAEVSKVISACLRAKAPLPGSLMNAIIEYGGYDCIPAMWNNYAMTKNSELLTAMALMMMSDKYEAFLSSDINDQLYVNGKPYKKAPGDHEMEMQFYPYGMKLTDAVVQEMRTLSTGYLKWKQENPS